MTNRLDTIKAAVEQHFEAKEAFESGTGARLMLRVYNPRQHAAMVMLRDLLPLVNVAVALSDTRNMDDLWNADKQLKTEVDKLLQDTAEPAPPAASAPIVWPESAKVCHCETFEGEGWECLRCGGGKF